MKELLDAQPVTMLPFVPQFVARPRWLARSSRDGGLMKFPNVVLPDGPDAVCGCRHARSSSRCVSLGRSPLDPRRLAGTDHRQGRAHGDDARRAVDTGRDAVVVSNHGGRQLDGVAPTLRVLPEVVAAVGGQAEVLLDGGIRRGSDIVKALCLGARAVLIGRAYAYGLGRRRRTPAWPARSRFCAPTSCGRSSCSAVLR